MATYTVLAYMVAIHWSSEDVRKIVTRFLDGMLLLPPAFTSFKTRGSTPEEKKWFPTIVNITTNVRASEQAMIIDGLTTYKQCLDSKTAGWYVYLYDGNRNTYTMGPIGLGIGGVQDFPPCTLPACILADLQALGDAGRVKYQKASTPADPNNPNPKHPVFSSHQNLDPYLYGLYDKDAASGMPSDVLHINAAPPIRWQPTQRQQNLQHHSLRHPAAPSWQQQHPARRTPHHSPLQDGAGAGPPDDVAWATSATEGGMDMAMGYP